MKYVFYTELEEDIDVNIDWYKIGTQMFWAYSHSEAEEAAYRLIKSYGIKSRLLYIKDGIRGWTEFKQLKEEN